MRVARYAAVIAVLSRYVVGGTDVNRTYPLFKQCVSDGGPWGDDIMVTKTICQVGCLMSSVSMALNGTGIPINTTTPSDPGTLNAWLRANGGYDNSNDLIETKVPEISPDRIAWPDDGMHKANDLSIAEVRDFLDEGRIVILNVMNGEHFVLCVGVDADSSLYLVNDSGFTRGNYSYGEVVGYRIFDMN